MSTKIEPLIYTKYNLNYIMSEVYLKKEVLLGIVQANSSIWIWCKIFVKTIKCKIKKRLELTLFLQRTSFCNYHKSSTYSYYYLGRDSAPTSNKCLKLICEIFQPHMIIFVPSLTNTNTLGSYLIYFNFYPACRI